MSDANYTTEQEGNNVLIYRNNQHVANYDPVEDDVDYVDPNFKRFAKGVHAAVDSLKADSENAKPGKASGDKEEISVLEVRIESLEQENEELKDTVEQLQSANERLADDLKVAETVAGANGKPAPEDYPSTRNTQKPTDHRFEDDVDESKAPQQDPMLGDLTPEYVKWFKKTQSPAVFHKRYHRRIKGV